MKVAALLCILSCICFTNQAFASLSDGLVAYYKFENNTEDISGNNNHAIANGGVSYVDAVRGKGLKLNGVNSLGGTLNPDFLIVKNSSTLQFNNNISVSYWVRIDGDRSQTSADCSGNSVKGISGTVLAKSGDRAGFWFSDSDTSTGFGISRGTGGAANNIVTAYRKFRHVAYNVYGVNGGNRIEVYINGEISSKNTGIIDLSKGNQSDMYIGVQNNKYGSCLPYWYPLDGVVDELRIYNRPLLPNEIEALALSSPGKLESENIAVIKNESSQIITASRDDFQKNKDATVTSGLDHMPIIDNDICVNATIPNPNPLPDETYEFYGDCKDGYGAKGVVVWKQHGEKTSISFLTTPSGYADTGFFKENEKDVFAEYVKRMPKFCKSLLDGGEYQGECRNGVPDGVGLWMKTERASYPGSFIRYNGQFKDGKFNGFGSWKNNYNCGFLGCTESTTKKGLWENGVFQVEAKNFDEYNQILVQRREAEIKEKYVKENTPRWEVERNALSQLKDKLNCEEATSFVEMHKDNPLIYFSEQFCKDERTFRNILSGKNPQQLYIAASKYEANGERGRAKDIYLSILDRFSADPFAVKASDRLTSISAVEAIEASNNKAAETIKRSNEKAAERASEAASSASRDARELQRKVCEDQRTACFGSCGSDSKCYNGCPSCSF